MLAHLLYGATATRIAPRSDPGLESLAGRGSREACGPARRAVSRHGGDEFLVLLSEVTRAEDAALTANKILDAVSKPHRIGDQDVTVTVSAGTDGDDSTLSPPCPNVSIDRYRNSLGLDPSLLGDLDLEHAIGAPRLDGLSSCRIRQGETA